MAVSPKQCIGVFNEKDQQELDRLEKHIDTELLNSYYGQGQINIEIHTGINPRVQKKMRTTYMAAGWQELEFKINRTNDPREPYTTTIIKFIG